MRWRWMTDMYPAPILLAIFSQLRNFDTVLAYEPEKNVTFTLFWGAMGDATEMQGECSEESPLATVRAYTRTDEGTELLAHLDVGNLGGAEFRGYKSVCLKFVIRSTHSTQYTKLMPVRIRKFTRVSPPHPS